MTTTLANGDLDRVAHDRIVLVASDHRIDDQPRVFVLRLPQDVLKDVMARAHRVSALSEAGLVARVVREVNSTPDLGADATVRPTVPGTRQRMLDQAKAYIDRHLEDDDLTPEKVAAGVFVSKRYLYMLFEEQPRSVSRHIIVRRLELIAQRLVDPAHEHLSAADLAMRVGFKDPSHFARAFKAEFGVTPGRFRSQHRVAGAA